MSSADAIRPLVDVILGHLEERVAAAESGGVVRKGPPAPIKEQDKQALATIYGMVLDKHLPAAWMAKWGLEVAAVLLTATIVVPKILEYRAYFKQKQAVAAKPKQPDEAGLGNTYRLQSARGDDEQLKERYENAVAQGRIPA